MRVNGQLWTIRQGGRINGRTTMFKTNVGGIDRVLRIVLGLALLAGFFLNADATYRWAYLIGIVP
ncbi:MAG: DUF2892 domain-containing protein, partial [Novosphingobium sp.]|nr:DUF2892 domain-containing protein [Novosphingobium sp.]